MDNRMSFGIDSLVVVADDGGFRSLGGGKPAVGLVGDGLLFVFGVLDVGGEVYSIFRVNLGKL